MQKQAHTKKIMKALRYGPVLCYVCVNKGAWMQETVIGVSWVNGRLFFCGNSFAARMATIVEVD